jgi:hypothetical protein
MGRSRKKEKQAQAFLDRARAEAQAKLDDAREVKAEVRTRLPGLAGEYEKVTAEYANDPFVSAVLSGYRARIAEMAEFGTEGA